MQLGRQGSKDDLGVMVGHLSYWRVSVAEEGDITRTGGRGRGPT